MAISVIPFPTRHNMCTLFATEIILRRAPAAGISVSIFIGEKRTDSGCQSLLDFYEPLTVFRDLSVLVEMANAFAEDIVRVKVWTLLSLPYEYRSARSHTRREQTIAD